MDCELRRVRRAYTPHLKQSREAEAAKIPWRGFARLMCAFVEVVRRADKRCPARCGQGDRAACSEHRNSTIQFRHRDLQRVQTPFVEKSEFHAHAFDEGDAKNQSRVAFPEGRRRSVASASDSFCARIFSSHWSSAAVTALRASLSNLPTTGRSSLASVFIRSPHSEMLPLLPRYFTRTAFERLSRRA